MVSKHIDINSFRLPILLVGFSVSCVISYTIINWETYEVQGVDLTTLQKPEDDALVTTIINVRHEKPEVKHKPQPSEVVESEEEESDTIFFRNVEDISLLDPLPIDIDEEEEVVNKVVMNPEVMAEYRGGDLGLVNDIKSRVDKHLVDEPGVIIVGYIITEEGEISNVEIIESTYKGAVNAHAVEVLKSLRYTKGAKVDGIPVQQPSQIPIIFE